MHADKRFRKELMSLAIPFALQWLLNALVGASDALMLGRLTQESIAAVSLANQVSFVLSLFIGAIVGAIGVLVAQYYGKGDFDTVRNLLSMALRYVLVLTVIFFLLAFFLPEHLMTVFTDEQDLIAIGASYLRIVSFSYLFQGASQCYLMLMKVDGRAKVSVWISAVTVVVDMTADYFLIYGAGKLPALGANGSAYSTIAVEVIALCWCVAASYQKGRIHPNSRSLLAPSGKGYATHRISDAGKFPELGTQHCRALGHYRPHGNRCYCRLFSHECGNKPDPVSEPRLCQRRRRHARHTSGAEPV